MTESEYIAALKSQWPQGLTASREVLSLVCLAVRDFPNSAQLWFMRGQLLMMSPDDYIFSEIDAVCSFERAIELDPTFADAYEHLGHYHDRIRDDPQRAMEFHRKAAKLKGEPLD